MQLKGCLMFFLLICQSLCYSQTKRFQSLTNSDGISQSEVYTMFEDSRGFMWFGTVDGLNQFDGYNITVYNTDKNNPNSITNNTIRSLAEDSLGRIWIGTDDGLCVYNHLTEKIHQIEIECVERDFLLQIRTIIITKQHLLLGTSAGMLRVNINTTNLDQIGQKFQWVNFSPTHRTQIYDATLRKDGSIWFITSNKLYGIAFQNESENPLIIESVADNRFINNIALKEDKFGNLWIITHYNGFFRYNPTTKALSYFTENISNRTVVSRMYSDAAIDKNHNLWIASRNKGLLFLDAKKLIDENPQFENIQNVPTDEKSLNSNLVHSLYVSKNNLLWVGTIGSGINFYDPRQKEFNHLKIPLNNNQTQSSSNFIRSVYADNDNNIWMGTHNNGLYIYNRKSNSFSKAEFGNETLFYIYDLGDGNTLICKSGEVNIVKLINNDIKTISSNFSSAFFYACKSNDDIVWLANLEGITKCRLVNGMLKEETVYNRSSVPGNSVNRKNRYTNQIRGY